MATGWLKSLQCKSNVLDDVLRPTQLPLLHPTPKKKPKPSSPTSCSSSSITVFSSSASSCSAASTKKSSLLPLGCGNSPRFLQDVAVRLSNHPTSCSFSDKPQRRRRRRHREQNQQSEEMSKELNQKHLHRKPMPKPLASPLHAAIAPPPTLFPTLTELPSGHSSRRVVELIFSSSWPRSPSDAPFCGSIDVLFRIHHPTRAASAFEEYRDDVRSRAGPADARCAADGNETMRFHPAATRRGGGQPVYDGTVRVLPATMGGMKGGWIRTFSGSGRAHDEGGASAETTEGARAMLVCRVIAGRVRTELGDAPDEYESVSAGKGELLVFDPRAVLPCFLIIYKL